MKSTILLNQPSFFQTLGLFKMSSYLFLLALLGLFASCESDDSINYREKIIGTWELKNVGELQSAYKNRPFKLKHATMVFDDNGTIETSLMSNSGKKPILHYGTWSMPTTGGALSIKADNSPFDDVLLIEFVDERTFWITLNDLQYQFIKTNSKS